MSGLEGTTEVPGIGKVKKAYVAVGAALVAGIVGFAWWRRTQAGDAGPDATDGGLYADTRTGSDLPTSGYSNPAPNADGQSGTGIGGDSTWKAPSTDQEWAQQAVEKLTWFEPSYVSATVGKYLARRPTTADEQTLIRTLWGLIGRPPSNPPLVNVTSTPTVYPTMIAPTGLKVVSVGTTSVSLDWAVTPGAKGYRVYVNGVQNGSTVLYSNAVARYLKSGTKYTINVAAIFRTASGDKPGPKSASITVTTKK